MSLGLRQRWQALAAIAPAADESTAAAFRAKQLAAIERMTLPSLISNLLNVFIVWYALHGWVGSLALYSWVLGILGVLGLGVRSWWRARQRVRSVSVSARALDAAVRNAAVLAAAWALLPVLFFDRTNPDAALLISLVSAGMLLGGAFVLATVPRAAVTFVAFMLAGCLAGLVRDGAIRNADLMLLLTVYASMVVTAVTTTSRTFGARLAAEADAQHQKELVSLLLKDFESNASDWLWESDQRGVLRHISARMRQVFGISPEQTLNGETLPQMLRALQSSSDGTGNGIVELEAKLQVPAPFTELTVAIEPGGDTRWWSLTAAPLLDAEGRHVGWRGVGTDISERRRSMAELAMLASTDSLTGLANRHTLRARLAATTQEAAEPFALLYFDLDNFKHVNDSLGHAAGDELLQQIARRLAAVSGPTDTLARLGGDEFAIICQRVADAQSAESLAGRLMEAIRAPFSVEGRSLYVASSAGIALFPQHGQSVDELLRNSDLALYAAKNAGRNTWRFFHEDLGIHARQRLAIQNDLVRAVAQRQLVLHYQPQVDLKSGVIRGMEALVRWNHPQYGLIAPAHFISLAEECGLIVAVGSFVLRQACLDAVQFPGNTRVAVNVSAVQFSRTDLLAEIRAVLEESRLAPERLEIEVTESVLIDDNEGAKRTLQQLRELGVGIALDDFGTGYSSLAYLRDYPLSKIKIDRSFVALLGKDPGTLAIVRSMVLLTQELALEVVAEGVESQGEKAILLELGCESGQGYLFSPPVPFAGLDALFASSHVPGAATISAQSMRLA